MASPWESSFVLGTRHVSHQYPQQDPLSEGSNITISCCAKGLRICRDYQGNFGTSCAFEEALAKEKYEIASTQIPEASYPSVYHAGPKLYLAEGLRERKKYLFLFSE